MPSCIAATSYGVDFAYEKKLKRKGYKRIVGVDEVGVGPLAGPVTACVFFTQNFKKLDGLKDSKKLTPQKREEFCKFFIKDPGFYWALASVMPSTIDRINIYEARKLAIKRAVLRLEKKLGGEVDFIILDGNIKLNLSREQEAIIKGDERIASVAAASIIAKVARDRTMMRYHKSYPGYGFYKHKGYGTKLHKETLKRHGLCPIHRKTFTNFLKGI